METLALVFPLLVFFLSAPYRSLSMKQLENSPSLSFMICHPVASLYSHHSWGSLSGHIRLDIRPIPFYIYQTCVESLSTVWKANWIISISNAMLTLDESWRLWNLQKTKISFLKRLSTPTLSFSCNILYKSLVVRCYTNAFDLLQTHGPPYWLKTIKMQSSW